MKQDFIEGPANAGEIATTAARGAFFMIVSFVMMKTQIWAPVLLALRLLILSRKQVDPDQGADRYEALSGSYRFDKVEAYVRTPLRFLMIATAALLGTVEIGSAANSHHPARTARHVAPAPVQGNWCLYYRAGGANCQFGDFQSCMYSAEAYGGRCQLSPSWRARYGDELPPLERWQYGGTPDYCINELDARCY